MGDDKTNALAEHRARRYRHLVVAFVCFLLVALLPLGITDVYTLNLLVLTLLYVMLAQSWNLLGGYCGQISLGHAVYFGVGAYATMLLFTKFAITPWVGMAFGGTCAAGLALLLGYPCFRIAGHYYTIATIVIAETALLLVLNWEWAGSAVGIQLSYGPDSWLSFQFGKTKLPYFYVSLALAAATWAIAWFIEDTRWGYWWRAVKDDVQAAESLGVHTFRSKMAASAVSAFFTAIGGGFYALFASYIEPQSVMGLQISVLISLPAVLGGLGTLWGPALGAVILIPLSELTRSYIGGNAQGIPLIVYGGFVLLVSLVRPQGLISLFERRSRARSVN